MAVAVVVLVVVLVVVVAFVVVLIGGLVSGIGVGGGESRVSERGLLVSVVEEERRVEVGREEAKEEADV